MAHEVSSWKEAGCVLRLNVAALSQREPYSQEINETFGEGGALNANYRTVDALAFAANILGKADLTYRADFVFKTGDNGEILFDFRDQHIKKRAREALAFLGTIMES